MLKKRYKQELTPEQLAALADAEIDTSDIPELGKAFWDKARVAMRANRGELSRNRHLRPKRSS